MDHRPKYKVQSYKNPRRQQGNNLENLGYADAFLDTILKTLSINEIIDNLEFIKIKTSALQKKILRKLENQAQTRRIFFQNHN